MAVSTASVTRTNAHLLHSGEVRLNKEQHNPNCLTWVDADEAWNTLCLPLRQEQGMKICATTRETLSDAQALMQSKGHRRCAFVLTDFHSIEQFIAERYDYEGI